MSQQDAPIPADDAEGHRVARADAGQDETDDDTEGHGRGHGRGFRWP